MNANIEDTLDALKAHSAEQQFLLDVLALWEHAKKAGYRSEHIKAFSFRSKFLSQAESRKLGRKYGSQLPCDTHFNCVRLKNGRLVEIPLYPRPTH